MATLSDKSADAGSGNINNGNLLEAQPMQGNDVQYGNGTAQRKRNTLRDGILLLLLTTLLAILIAAMVGVFQIKNEIEAYNGHGMYVPSASVITHQAAGIANRGISAPSSDGCESMTSNTDASTTMTTLTIPVTFTAVTTIVTTTAYSTVTLVQPPGSSIYTTESADALSAACTTNCGTLTTTVTNSFESSFSAPAVLPSSSPALNATSTVFPVAVSAPSSSDETIIQTMSTTVTDQIPTPSVVSITSTVTAYGSVTPYYSANGTYPLPTAPTASNPSVYATSAVSGVTGVPPPTVSSSGLSVRPSQIARVCTAVVMAGLVATMLLML